MFISNSENLIHRFIRRFLAFCIIPLLGLLFVFLLVLYTRSNVTCRIDPGVREIYAGDSHIQCAVIDSLMKNGRNISKTSESYYFTYYKLKKILEINPDIRRVYLGASYHNLSDHYDRYISGENTSFVSTKYFYLLPPEKQLQVMGWSVHDFPRFLRGIIFFSYTYIIKKSPYDFGGYSNFFFETAADKKAMDKRIKLQYHSKDRMSEYSTVNIEYYFKIITMCREKNVELILLNTPLHGYFRAQVPKFFIERFNNITDSLNLRVLDFSNLTLSDSCFTPDGDHLTVKGAKLITAEIIRQDTKNQDNLSSGNR